MAALMADVEVNREVWRDWDWSQGGEEWSASWGGTQALWFGTLLPRIHAFIPTGTILEIAPGFGRWTQFLKDGCERLVIVDLAENCIDHCRERFADVDHIEYHVNDGRSLEMVADESIDFVFSFDSLVHVEADVLEAYLGQLARKLRPDGVGFIHHSNIGDYRKLAALTRRTPDAVRGPLVRRGVLLDLGAWRAESVTADRFAAQCDAAGLACVSQEKINWELGRHLTDTLSVFTRPGSRWHRERRVTRNPRFRSEARRMAGLYARSA
jgi:SAM-dependent methyltransferase